MSGVWSHRVWPLPWWPCTQVIVHTCYEVVVSIHVLATVTLLLHSTPFQCSLAHKEYGTILEV